MCVINVMAYHCHKNLKCDKQLLVNSEDPGDFGVGIIIT